MSEGKAHAASGIFLDVAAVLYYCVDRRHAKQTTDRRAGEYSKCINTTGRECTVTSWHRILNKWNIFSHVYCLFRVQKSISCLYL